MVLVKVVLNSSESGPCESGP